MPEPPPAHPQPSRAVSRPAKADPTPLDVRAAQLHAHRQAEGKPISWRAAYRRAQDDGAGWSQAEAADRFNQLNDHAGGAWWDGKRVSDFERWPATAKKESLTGDLLIKWAKVYHTHPRNLLSDEECLRLPGRHQAIINNHQPDTDQRPYERVNQAGRVLADAQSSLAKPTEASSGWNDPLTRHPATSPSALMIQEQDAEAAMVNLLMSGVLRPYYGGGGDDPQGGDIGTVQRRQLLQLMGVGLVAGSSAHATSELVRGLLERALNTADAYSLEDWELACLDHAYAIRTQPPAEAHQALVTDLAALSDQIRRAEGPVGELMRVAAWLSVLHSKVLTRIGQFETARRWWITTRHAADQSGDPDMRVWVRGDEAAFGLYAPRPPQSVVALARSALKAAGSRTSAGLLIAMSGLAQALAALGRHDEAERILVKPRVSWRVC